VGTKYNLVIAAEPNNGRMPEPVYETSIAQLGKSGLIGEKHITTCGHVLGKFDPKCPTLRNGVFELHYREGMDMTAREMVEDMGLTTSGFDGIGMQLVEHGEAIVEALEDADPAIGVVPLEMYGQMPLIETMELNLACGKHSTHVHCRDFYIDIIRFWKPPGDDWYDYDTLMNYLASVFDEYARISVETRESQTPLLEKITNYFRLKRLMKLVELRHRIAEDPDSVYAVDLY